MDSLYENVHQQKLFAIQYTFHLVVVSNQMFNQLLALSHNLATQTLVVAYTLETL